MNEKERIYDELSRVLTEYEENLIGAEELYNMLVHIQNNWDIITGDTDENNLCEY